MAKELIYLDDARRAVLKFNPDLAFCLDGLRRVNEIDPTRWHESMCDALESIIWYNGHYNWLRELKERLEKLPEGETCSCPFGAEQWHYEPHVIWMLLVGMFGEWGTSIRGGWIDRPKECASFIDAVCREPWEAEERRTKDGN